jgi:hypothetical protein
VPQGQSAWLGLGFAEARRAARSRDGGVLHLHEGEEVPKMRNPMGKTQYLMNECSNGWNHDGKGGGWMAGVGRVDGRSSNLLLDCDCQSEADELLPRQLILYFQTRVTTTTRIYFVFLLRI